MRGSLTTVPAMGAGWVALGLLVATGSFGMLGVRGCTRRATD